MRRGWKSLFEKLKKFGSFRAMKIWNCALFFLGVLVLRPGGIQDKRENSVEKSWPLVHRGDVLVHGQFI